MSTHVTTYEHAADARPVRRRVVRRRVVRFRVVPFQAVRFRAVRFQAVRFRAGPWVRRALVFAAPAVAAGWLLSHQELLAEGARLARTGDKGWLALALVATVAKWPAGGLNLQGAVVERLPAGRLLTAQLAGSFANHVLPLGLGANGVDARFLHRCGVPLPRAVSAVAISVAVGTVVNLLLVVAVLAAASPDLAFRLELPALQPGPAAVLALVLGAAVVILTVGMARGHRRRPGFLHGAVADLVALMRRPSRLLMLCGGALLQKCLPALILIAVLRALYVTTPTSVLLAAYFAASSVAGFVPTPGGLGSMELTLGFALVAVGVPAPLAVAAVLCNRLITSGLTLVPAGIAFVYLLRRNAL